MKKTIAILLVAAATFGSVSLFSAKKKPLPASNAIASVMPEITGIEVGMTAPNFEMNDQDGKPLALAKYRGKIVVLDFWATWCGPCRRALPHFKDLWAKYKNKDVVFISISLDKDLAKWKEFIKAENMDWLHVADGKFWANAVAKQYGVESIPSVWVLDRWGVIQGKGLYGAEVENIIEKSISMPMKKSAKPSKSE